MPVIALPLDAQATASPRLLFVREDALWAESSRVAYAIGGGITGYPPSERLYPHLPCFASHPSAECTSGW